MSNTTKVFTVLDTKAQAYLPPFYIPNEDVAKRAMQQCLMDPNHAFAMSPQDYQLYILGEFDQETGKFTLLDGPTHVVNLVNLVQQKELKLNSIEEQGNL